MEKKWYIVHTQSGCEQKAKENLQEIIRLKKVGESFDEILIPSEEVEELVKGEKKKKSKKYFPGYILVKMELTNETWHVVKDTPKISGFVGNAQNPSPLGDEEVKRITHQISEGVLKTKPKEAFEKGENIRVVDGPFSNFNGIIEDVKPDKRKLKVLVSIFGRSTPVELDFTQVEKT